MFTNAQGEVSSREEDSVDEKQKEMHKDEGESSDDGIVFPPVIHWPVLLLKKWVLALLRMLVLMKSRKTNEEATSFTPIVLSIKSLVLWLLRVLALWRS
jgi:hypothetical protein